MAPEIEQLLQARYEILGPLGAGHFSVVYKARQVATGQLVAVKVLKLAEEREPAAAKRVQRFRREMQLCAQLHHPNIVRLIDSGEVGEQTLYAVFEFVPGLTLGALLSQEGALGIAEARHLMLQVLDALCCAHEQGVVHRDMKPQNIMITTTGARRNAMVVDFGVSAVTEGMGDGDGRITEPYEIVGTPAYASPEQLRCLAIDGRSDLYSFGLVFLECLTGRRVMQGTSLPEVLRTQLGTDPVPIPESLLGHEIYPVLRAATEKDVALRKVTARGLFQALSGLTG